MLHIVTFWLGYNYSMERKEHTSSNEAELLEPVIAGDDAIDTSSSAPAGRYYECFFCRRGFSTAQALGGHMNIHRRDRPRIRPAWAPPPPPRRDESYHPYLREQWRMPMPAADNYIVYFPESPPSTESKRPREWSVMAGEREGKEREMEDLDLELRLGHGGR